jgi:membrane protein YqaA with SNARE-associated domain
MTTQAITIQQVNPAITESRKSSFLSPRVLLTVGFTIAISVLVGIAVIQFREVMQGMGQWGYLGVFLVETANSAAIMIPTPSIAYTLAMSAILNPFVIGIVGGIGSSLGELVGYALGASGRQMLNGSKLQARFESLARRRVGPVLFAFALIPLSFDIAGVWAGTVRYSPIRFFLWVAAGKIIKVTAIALAGHYGVNMILGFIS